MARRKTSLREYQANFAERLRQSSAGSKVASKLGFQIGEQNWLVNLDEVSEVLTVPTLAAVPLTQPWFCGISNIRGNLYSVLDFSAFAGGAPVTVNYESRVLLIAHRLITGSALLVRRMVGLRNPDQFTQVDASAEARAWTKAVYADAGGVRWQELDVAALVKEARFVEVSR